MNPEDSKQFDEIMGRNYTPEERKNLHAKGLAEQIHAIGESLFGPPLSDEEQKSVNDTRFLSRVRNFPENMLRKDKNGEMEVFHKDPDGWEHTWGGGPYIEHTHPSGAEAITNIHDYSLRHGEQPYEKGLFTPHEFLQHVQDFEEQKQDYKD